ncbi:7-carboxy-7-deazaguanine synthase QueE [Methanocella sp. MCL-LM]|uniref:7-carboxy-7-deazaguanine synthase QueE n=1 Tax=Methanocella sp. MCL-LM TaxID=3412035 RepID=UPI003C7738EC
MKAPVREIFVSVQGEGPYVGYRQTFVRFPKCNLECLYCDTAKDWDSTKKCLVEKTPGSGDFAEEENPMTPSRLLNIAERDPKIHSISLTGGEPLLYGSFIKELKGAKHPLYLETNMTLPEGAKDVKDVVKIVSGDFKLKAHCDFKDQYEKYFNATARSFSILRRTSFRDCYCKIIVTPDLDKEDLMHALDQIKGTISALVLQPVTPVGPVGQVSPKFVLELQKAAMDEVEDVRVIPQTHRMWGCL